MLVFKYGIDVSGYVKAWRFYAKEITETSSQTQIMFLYVLRKIGDLEYNVVSSTKINHLKQGFNEIDLVDVVKKILFLLSN